MSTLTVGRLVAELAVDPKGWKPGLRAADQDMDQFGRQVEQHLRDVEQEFERAGKESGEQFGEGVTRAADDGLRGGRSRLAATGKESGEAAGKAITDGVERGTAALPHAVDGPMRDLGGKMKAGAAAAGLVAGAALTAGMADAMNTESALKKLDAQLGASEFDSAKHGKVAGQLYVDAYGESMDEVADAIRAVVQNLDFMRDASEEDLRGIGELTISTAKIMDEEFQQVTRAVSQMLRTGMADSAEEAFDIIVKGTQIGANAAEDLLDTFIEYSTQFREIGLNGQKFLGLVQQALRGGARDADVAADAMKEFAIRSKDGSAEAATAYKALGLNAEKMTAIFSKGGPKAADALQLVFDRIDKVKGGASEAAITFGLFGSKSEDLGDALFAMDPATAIAALGELDGVAKKANDTLGDTTESAVTHFKRSFQQHVTQFIDNEVIPSFRRLTESADFQEIADKARELGADLKETYDKMVADIQQWADDHEQQINDYVDKAEAALDRFRSMAEEIITDVQMIWDAHGKEMLSAALGFIDGILQAMNGMWQMIEGIFQTFRGLVTGDWQAFWDGIANIAEGQVNFAGGIINAGMSVIVGTWGGDWGKMKESARNELSQMQNIVSGHIGQLKGLFSGAGGWLWDAGRAIITGLINGIKSSIGALQNTLTGITHQIPGWKGPPEVDRTLLTDNGRLIMRSLVDGLQAGEPDVNRYLTGLTDSFSPTFGLPDAGRGGQVGGTTVIRFDLAGVSDPVARALMEYLQKVVRTEYRGDAGLALGGRR